MTLQALWIFVKPRLTGVAIMKVAKHQSKNQHKNSYKMMQVHKYQKMHSVVPEFIHKDDDDDVYIKRHGGLRHPRSYPASCSPNCYKHHKPYTESLCGGYRCVSVDCIKIIHFLDKKFITAKQPESDLPLIIQVFHPLKCASKLQPT